MSNFKLFDDDTDLNEDPLNERRLQGQWIYTGALRDGLSIAYRRPVTYKETLDLADKFANEFLGRQNLLFYPGESNAARYYRERANLLTARLQREKGSVEKPVLPIEAVDKDIIEMEDLLISDSGQNRTQRVKLGELHAIRKEFEEQMVTHRVEPEVLIHDWNRGINLPTFVPQFSHNYHDFALPNQRIMRLWLTHATKAENITGVDFIYEYHRPKERKARLAAVQYKLPESGKKNIIIERNSQAERQLDKMCDVFCDSELCAGPSYDGTPLNNRPYQLPQCCAFFRPTNRLQNFNSRLATTGYYIRRCDIERVCKFTAGGNKVITPEISMKHGISFTIFEELFNTEKLGSRWLTYEELENFHQRYEVNKEFEQAGIYFQEIT